MRLSICRMSPAAVTWLWGWCGREETGASRIDSLFFYHLWFLSGNQIGRGGKSACRTSVQLCSRGTRPLLSEGLRGHGLLGGWRRDLSCGLESSGASMLTPTGGKVAAKMLVSDLQMQVEPFCFCTSCIVNALMCACIWLWCVGGTVVGVFKWLEEHKYKFNVFPLQSEQVGTVEGSSL